MDMPTAPGAAKKNPLVQLEDFLELYLVKKAPVQLPAGLKDFIVTFGPWLMAIFLVISLPALLFVLGVSTVALPFAMVSGFGNTAQFVLSIVSFVLSLIALPGLFKRTKIGWKFLFYSELVTCLAYLVSGQVISLIIFGTLGLYFIFQVKDKYQ